MNDLEADFDYIIGPRDIGCMTEKEFIVDYIRSIALTTTAGSFIPSNAMDTMNKILPRLLPTDVAKEAMRQLININNYCANVEPRAAYNSSGDLKTLAKYIQDNADEVGPEPK